MSGGLLRAAAALVAAAALLAASAPARAYEIPDLPGGTDPGAGFPPLVPRSLADREQVKTWCEAAVEAGRARVGTRLGGDLLLSAAWALEKRVGNAAAAVRYYDEAAAAYPASARAAGRLMAALEAARLCIDAGETADAGDAIARARRWWSEGPPVDADEAESTRWNGLAARVVVLLPRLEADRHEADGRFAKAAAVLEAFADRHESSLDVSRTWMRAARLRARADDVEQALADVDRALALDLPDKARADWSFWRLHLLHGRLDDEAAVPIATTWPGEAFTRDVHACLSGLRGNPYVGEWLLSIASSALAAGEDATALDLYLLALGDPAFVDRAEGRPRLWRGLLAAFPVALRLRRLDDAERVLGAIDRIGGIPAEEMDGYRVALASGRADAEASPPPHPDEPVEAPPPEPPPSRHRGRLRLPPAREERGGRAGGGAASAPEDDPPAWLAPALGTAALLLLAFLVVRRRRR